MQAPHPQQRQRGSAPPGLRLPRAAAPAKPDTTTWGSWQVVDRANGFHVSRGATDGTATEFLRNEVGAVKVFRKRALAEVACAQANFTANAQRLSAEPLLGGAV